jgi:hypothetical protein
MEKVSEYSLYLNTSLRLLYKASLYDTCVQPMERVQYVTSSFQYVTFFCIHKLQQSPNIRCNKINVDPFTHRRESVESRYKNKVIEK